RRLQRVVGVGGRDLRLRYAQVVAPKDKPYRVYKGGRAKGPVRPLSQREQDQGPPVTVRDGGAPPRGPRDEPVVVEPWPEQPEPLRQPPPPERPGRPRRRTARRIAFWTGLVVLLGVVVFAGWGAFGYFAFRGG